MSDTNTPTIVPPVYTDAAGPPLFNSSDKPTRRPTILPGPAAAAVAAANLNQFLHQRSCRTPWYPSPAAAFLCG
jgi:hypothetical protein